MKFSKALTFFYEAQEYFILELQKDNTVLVIKSNLDKSWVEIRGKPRYETSGHDANDDLHKTLDALDPATVSNLFAGVAITLNPKNPRSVKSIELVRKIFKANK